MTHREHPLAQAYMYRWSTGCACKHHKVSRDRTLLFGCGILRMKGPVVDAVWLVHLHLCLPCGSWALARSLSKLTQFSVMGAEMRNFHGVFNVFDLEPSNEGYTTIVACWCWHPLLGVLPRCFAPGSEFAGQLQATTPESVGSSASQLRLCPFEMKETYAIQVIVPAQRGNGRDAEFSTLECC